MTWQSLTMHLADASLRAIALTALAAVLVLFLRRNAAAQHSLWTAVLAGMLLLPALRPLVPAARVRMPERNAAVSQATAAPEPNRPVVRNGPPAPPEWATKAPSPFQILWPRYAGMIYAGGLFVFATRLWVGLFLTRRLLRQASPLGFTDAGVPLFESDRVRVPLTVGLRTPGIFLPAGWRDWTEATRRAVIAHEVEHARRRDPLVLLLAAVNKCIFWFHPLAWWMERRLAVLAEHVADDAALAASSSPDSYARVVLDFASRMEKHHSRMVWHGAAMSGPIVARRIRRVMDGNIVDRTRRLSRMTKTAVWSSAALLMCVSAAIEIQTPLRAQTNDGNAAAFGGFGFAGEAAAPPITAEAAANLEQQLAANPGNEAIRRALLHHYEANGRNEDRVRLVLWAIDHQPESVLHAYRNASISPTANPGDYEEARKRWQTQISQHPNDPRVLGNAARALAASSLSGAIDLLKRARQIEPNVRTLPLARLYSMVLTLSANPQASRTSYGDQPLAAAIRQELQNSKDAVLVGSVAGLVQDYASQRSVSRISDSERNALRTLAIELTTHARALDPRNSEWSDLAEGAQRLPDARPVEDNAPADPAIRVGGNVQKAKLVEAPSPSYPADAKAAGATGVVRFQVRIGADGRVTDTTLVSGNRLLVQPAADAVKQYVYKPTLLNSKPVVVITTVEVPFTEKGS